MNKKPIYLLIFTSPLVTVFVASILFSDLSYFLEVITGLDWLVYASGHWVIMSSYLVEINKLKYENK